MQIDLIIRKENDPNAYTVTCDVAERVVFGRNIGSPVDLAGSDISREHFALFSRNGQICVQDLSSNGTFVNGKPVVQKKSQKLSRGDVISVPGYEIELGGRLRAASVNDSENLVISPQIEKTVGRRGEPFTVWEIVVIAAAVATFALVIYYVSH